MNAASSGKIPKTEDEGEFVSYQKQYDRVGCLPGDHCFIDKCTVDHIN